MKQDEQPAIRHTTGSGSQKPAPSSQSRYRFAGGVPGSSSEGDLHNAVQNAPHRYLGIKATGTGKASAVFPIHDRNIESTDQAIGQAMSWWPGITDWTLCGADLLYDQQHVTGAQLPAGAEIFHQPDDLMTFSADQMQRAANNSDTSGGFSPDRGEQQP